MRWERRRRGRGWPIGLILVQLLLGFAAAQVTHHFVGWRQLALLVAGPVALRVRFGRPVLAAVAVGLVDVAYLFYGYPIIGVLPSTILAAVGPIARARREAFLQWRQEERRRREAEQQRRQEQQLRQV